ncbi:uncharacterized protein PGTG_19785 [Puccinia graminis f. sp. tritici CRL 75-36-700-3]|uniref:Integrase catalytic domain-containing protein n=1 Tax=Puccinia graminis f. sp. tritici (strain CRL 75-36-700-3 / race SCCL) TaxID=418459 RepID=E3LB33_PUCGT|nr:uncharacterized protein PGTG_19785 [Puccinia graminis f. sp. tritici CRL 75-36-700-3]EFP93758.2 hypothetical protein PGTG_19785 [Puccinia graminis f. sp. tritici CRL 75-36-700-3]
MQSPISPNQEFEEDVLSEYSTISYPDRSDFPEVLSELDIKEAIASLVSQGVTGKEIHKFLQGDCGLKISLRTLNRKRAEWGLRNCDLPKPPKNSKLTPDVEASLISSHQQGFKVSEIRSRLLSDTGKDVSHRTVERYLAILDLKLKRNDLADGKVTRDDVVCLIDHARKELLATSAGYRRMNNILKQEYKIHVPRLLVYEILSELDPQGMADRLRHSCKRRIFRTHGPNHIWSADGHDKLKPFGITIYGFIDAWSQRILGMYAHVTNNDPLHVGVSFLQLVAEAGGVPLTVTVDRGTETGEMGTHMIELTQRYTGITFEEAQTHMHHTKSTRNQKIESLWSRMMKEHNRPLIDTIWTQIEEGKYDRDDDIQKLLFLFLWMPVVQKSVDRWVTIYNASRKRKDKLTELPTACSPNFSYSTPEHFGATDQLIHVPQEDTNFILENTYPERDAMFTHTPDWFHDLASLIMQEMGFHFDQMAPGGVWAIFDEMLPYIQANIPSDYIPNSSVNNSATQS